MEFKLFCKGVSMKKVNILETKPQVDTNSLIPTKMGIKIQNLLT